jgi:alkylation response protein AidB-like acyl-CoA dehydrogenase
VCLGIAHSAIDELVELAATKTATGQRRRLAERAHVQEQVALAEAELRSARSLFYATVDEAWQRAVAGEEHSLKDRALMRIAATNAARASARAVDRMYNAGGGTSIYAASRLQRDFRDIHAATQHVVVSQPTLELAGKVLLGVETDVMML